MTTPRKSVPVEIILAAVLLLGRPSGSSAELCLVLDGRGQPLPGFDVRPEGIPGGAGDFFNDPPATGPDQGETAVSGPVFREGPGTTDSPPGPAPGSFDSAPVLELPPMITSVVNPSVINPSVMAVPSWELSVTIAPRMDVTRHLSAPPSVSPALSSDVGRNSGVALAYEGDPYDEPEKRVGMAYAKPLSRVFGTLFLFLILGLIFLKGRRDVGSR